MANNQNNALIYIDSMVRSIQTALSAWLTNQKTRKPLILRGARQVGKTWLVRNLAREHDLELLEYNFERDPSAGKFFSSNDPVEILSEIALEKGNRIDPGRVILFLDEIQAAGDIIGKLRWFYESMPSLPVVAAGSLLEFTLSDHTFSMPVGRIQFLHVEPMSFAEFLDAHGQTLIREALLSWRPGTPFSPVLHEQALKWFDRYAMIGGMPALVKSDTEGSNAEICRAQQLDLLATYRSDFAKYRNRLEIDAFDAVLRSVAYSLGRKFVYSHVDEGVKQHLVKKAVELLAQAKVCHIVKYSSANGLPLGGETKDSFRKIVLNDVGLLHALLKTPADSMFPRWNRISPQVKGQISDQCAAQQLRLLGPLSGDGPELYYWQREGGRPGEIDYLIQESGSIIPVELKSGVAGAMKSLHQFMYDKKLDFAVRIDRNPPSMAELKVKTTQGDAVSYRLLSIPPYLTGTLATLIGDTAGETVK